ncbi:hypothetical protein V8C86DRAFT_3090673 [Haematococcus lacustris]
MALDLQRLELACAFLLTDRLWAVAMADLAQLAVGLHANTAQRRLLTTPSALYSPRPTSLSPTASGPTAKGGQQGPGWVEKLEPFWQLFVTYVVEATAGTEHNLAWWMAAVKAGNAYLPDLVNPLQRAQPINAKMLVGAAAQYVHKVRQQGEGGWEVLLAMAGRMRKRFRSTAAMIHNLRIAAASSPEPGATAAGGGAGRGGAGRGGAGRSGAGRGGLGWVYGLPALPSPSHPPQGRTKTERECVAGARRVFQLSLTASSLALDLQRLELACAFLLTDRLWAVAMADLAQLAVGLHANTAQRRLLTTPSAISSPRPASLSPTASDPTAMGGQQGPGWVEKLEPFWQLFVTYVVEATAGTEHNLAWWMAAVKAGNAYLPDLVTPLQRAELMNAKMLVVAAAQYVQEVSGAAERGQQGQGGSRGAAAGGGRVGGAAGHGRPHAQEVPLQVVSSLMQALVAAGEARCLRLHQQLGTACNVTSQGNGVTAAEQVNPMQARGASVGSLGASGGAAAGAT